MSGGTGAPCRVGQLSVSLQTPPGAGAAGSVYRSLVFTNTGHGTCTLDGHPGVSYVAGADGHQVGGTAIRDTSEPLTTVTLRPGQAAHATLRETATGAFDPSACRPTRVRGLRVYPPDETRAVFVAAPRTVCANPQVDRPRIGPVRPGGAGG